ncbi:hypothetical protein Q4512_15580, partial [Oceanihabitans sp. 2_MG-2023]|nr:hypothetical protein [Oceanihabitans sp. 2_MG-2023]
MKIFTRFSNAKSLSLLVFALFSFNSIMSQTNAPSIQSGVSFQWSDSQTVRTDPATIQSITVGTRVFTDFGVPQSYALTQLGQQGHNQNGVEENGVNLATSSDPVITPNWDALALAAFQDKNLNHYFEASQNGQDICDNYTAADGVPNEESTIAQRQTFSYSPGIRSTSGSIIAITERNANNCYHIEFFGTKSGSTTTESLGSTFVNPQGPTYYGHGGTGGANDFGTIDAVIAPTGDADYWLTNKVVGQNGGTIGIALFYVDSIAELGSIITDVQITAANYDHGDGKLFIFSLPDADGDGFSDIDDLDDDDDGILDIDESNGYSPSYDEDGDGIPNWEDTVDDGTGDGSLTDYTDANGDGVPDVYDFDGDGIPNHLDFDSDNDGCFDAIEGGDFIVVGEVEAEGALDGDIDATTGVPDNVDVNNGQTIGTSQNASAFDVDGQCDRDNDGVLDGSDICQGSDDSVDTDNDTVPDGCDLDNDNDGILDINEGICTTPIQSGTWTLVSDTEATFDYGNGVTARLVTNSTGFQVNGADSFNTEAFWSETLSGDTSLVREYSWGSTLTVSFEDAAGDPINVTNPILHVDRLGGSDGATENSALMTLQGGLTWTALSGTADFLVTSNTAKDSGSGNPVGTGYTFESTQNVADGTAAGSLQVNGNISTFTIQFVQDGVSGVLSDGIEFILFACPDLDTDEDGIPDYLDLDSDGDGCSDALEGADSISASSVVDGQLTGAVNTGTGVPSNVDENAGQGVGGAIDGTPSDLNGQCDSDNDGTIDANDLCPGFDDKANNDGDALPDGCDEDDDNDGISDVNEGLVTTPGQPACTSATVLNFNNAYSEEPGGDGNINTFLLNETFRFPGVIPGVDALVTIVELNGTTVPVLDDNSLNVNSFQPRSAFTLTNVGDRAYTEYRFDFVTTNGVAGVNDVIIPEFFVNFNDVDGGASYGEQNWSQLANSYTVNQDTELLVTFEDNFIVGTAGITEYPSVTNGFPQVNYATQHNGKSSYTIRLGVVARVAGASASGRQHNVEFNCITNFVNPINTTILDSDGDGIPNHLDLDSDGDTCPDALEGNGGLVVSQLDANGMITGAINTNGIPNAANSGNGQADVSSTDDTVNGCIGSVTGTVYNDEDGNGAQEGTETGYTS